MATDQEALLLQFGVQLNDLQKQMDRAVGVVSDGGAKMVLRSKEAMAAIEKSYGSIDAKGFRDGLEKIAETQDKLTAAQQVGNAAEAKGLREQLVLQQAVQKAGTAQLETQLAIARATGNKGQVTQLSEALALQTQIGKLQGVGIGGSRGLIQAETTINAIAAAEKAAEGADVGKALDKVFDSSKLALVEEGSAKIRVFGSAIEPLGAYGIAAAVGIAAVAAAAEQARKAMEWADDLDRTAKKLGTTTTSLQAFDYASVATSIGLEQGREALSAFNDKVGSFESHVRDKSMEKFATGVHLTRQEVSQTVDPVDKLRLVMEKLATLPDAQQRASGAKAFGLEGLLPIINEGGEGIDKFIGKMKEAQANGSIVDPRAIRDAAELNDKVEELTHRIGVDFKKSFLDLAPAIESVAVFIERCTHALSDFAGELPLAIRGIEDLLSKIPHLPSGGEAGNALKTAAENATIALVPGGQQAAQLLGGARGAFQSAVERGRTADLRDKVNNLLAGKPVDLTGSDFELNGRQGPGQQLAFDKSKPAPHDETLSFDKSAQDAYDSGLKALIAAQTALTGDIQARADSEKTAVDADLTKKLYDLGVEEAKIRAAKNDSHKTEQLALIEKAKTEEQNAAAAKKELIDRQTAFAIEDRTIELYKSKLDSQIAELTAQGSIATTAKERADIELKILALRQQFERDLHDSQIDRRTHTDTNPGGDLSPDQADKLKSDFNATQAAQGAAQRQQISLSANPVERFQKSVQDFTTLAENAGVSAMENLSNGLANAIVNAKSLGDVGKQVFQQLIAELLAAAIKKDIAAPLIGLIPGFASGGAIGGAGTGTSDSIPAMLSNGEFVVRADVAQKHRALLEAINSGRVPHFANGGPVTPSFPALSALQSMSMPQSAAAPVIINNDLRGAIVQEDLYKHIQSVGQQAAQAGARGGRALAAQDSRQNLRGMQTNLQLLGTT